MICQAMSLLAVLAFLMAGTASAQKASTEGFITIDCGYNGTSYTDSVSGIVYSSDEAYASAGVNREVSSERDLSSVKQFYRTVRSFPDGVRNCYTLAPVKAGAKYRINAEFYYGNYDGLRRSPTFDLYLGVNLWTTLEVGEFSRREIIAVAAGESLQVCLVNTGKGTPFITELDLRPLPFASYSPINDSLSTIVFNTNRINYGARVNSPIAYPEDIYDRTWVSRWIGANVSTTLSVDFISDTFPVPEVVLQTASVMNSLADTIEITIPGTAARGNYVYMHFAELQVLASNETREFSFYAGNEVSISSFRPAYLSKSTFYSKPPGRPGGFTYSLRATSNSTLPPMINALEIFSVIDTSLLPTNGNDVNAILPLKKLVNGKKNWQGDPCVPQNFMWSGLGCGYDELRYSRITSLDLTRSGLTGQIPPSIANLTSLTSLNLSYNSFTGDIPAFLGEMTALKYLNLEGNNLSGTIPRPILDKLKTGSLMLNINNNPVCSTSDICQKIVLSPSPNPKKKSVLPIVIGVVGGILLLLVAAITLFILHRKKTRNNKTGNQVGISVSQQSGNSTPQMASVEKGLHSESNQFSKDDIIKITRNFLRPIGQGGFGTVFHGALDDGTEVAVKLVSTSAVNGERQFRAEAELLTRVHHRNLVSLLGYCNEILALVYEYVPNGTLADHLSARPPSATVLSWNDRLRIALEAAQGLDYLHYGCTPPIVHRDVKPANFLLTKKLEVKIADFGLSRSSVNERNSFAQTIVAGTPGYLDPEYQQTSLMSEKSDVYSFGVLLLELIMGKPPISRERMATHITKEVRTKMERGDLAEIADPKMQGNYDINSMWRLIEIALSCASFNSMERPTMSDVSTQLKECLAAEVSREFPSGMNSGAFEMYPSYSIESTSPAAR